MSIRVPALIVVAVSREAPTMLVVSAPDLLRSSKAGMLGLPRPNPGVVLLACNQSVDPQRIAAVGLQNDGIGVFVEIVIHDDVISARAVHQPFLAVHSSTASSDLAGTDGACCVLVHFIVAPLIEAPSPVPGLHINNDLRKHTGLSNLGRSKEK